LLRVGHLIENLLRDAEFANPILPANAFFAVGKPPRNRRTGFREIIEWFQLLAVPAFLESGFQNGFESPPPRAAA
jgi:hypothetical protein